MKEKGPRIKYFIVRQMFWLLSCSTLEKINILEAIDFSNRFLLFFRWKIVVHGGVDCYSRLPVYLHASDNNRSSTVLTLFWKEVEKFGSPSRVRSAQGGENL